MNNEEIFQNNQQRKRKKGMIFSTITILHPERVNRNQVLAALNEMDSACERGDVLTDGFQELAEHKPSILLA